MPVTAAIVSASIGMAQGLANTGLGIHDRRKAKEMFSGLTDPDYIIPPAILESVANAKNMASTRSMPGQSYLEGAQDDMYGGLVSQISEGADDSQSALSALLRAYGGRQKRQNEIGLASSQYQADAQSNVRKELNNLGFYEDKEFGIDVMQPYMRKTNWAQMLMNNGNSNISTGTSQMLNSGGDLATTLINPPTQ